MTTRLVTGILFLTMVVGAAQASMLTFTDLTAFESALGPHSATQVDFDSTPAGTAISDGDLFNGVQFGFSDADGNALNARVSDDYDTTSGPNYLGLDHPSSTAFLSGDAITLTFSGVIHAIGFYLIASPGDLLFADDVALSSGASGALVDPTAATTLADGGEAFFIGLVDTAGFNQVELSSICCGFFEFTLDDILFAQFSATTPGIPEPSTLALLLLVLVVWMATGKRGAGTSKPAKTLGVALAVGAVSVSSLSVTAATRVSLSDVAGRVVDLEGKHLVLRKDVDDGRVDLEKLEEQVRLNSEAIAAIEPIPGPPGPAGPLSGLRCDAGEVAVFDGVDWVCSSASVASSGGEASQCIEDFFFTLDSEAGPDAKWSVLCDPEDHVIDVKGPLTTSETGTRADYDPALLTSSGLTEVEFELTGTGEFVDSVVAVYPTPVDYSETFSGDSYLEFTLIAHLTSPSTRVAAWANDTVPSSEEFRLMEPSSGMELALQQCLPSAHRLLPKRTTSGDLYLEQTLVIRCSELVDNELVTKPLVQYAVAEHFNPLPEPGEFMDLQFEPIAGIELGAFNRLYGFHQLRELTLPYFFKSERSRDLERWTAGPVSLSFSVEEADTDLPL